MSYTLRTLLLSLSLIVAGTAAAQAPTPNGQVGGVPVQAVAQQGNSQFMMPISLDLLPYGTVELSPGRYMINNYEGRGIDIYIYSPQPLRIATYAEMMQFQANFALLAQDMTRKGVTAQAAPVSTPMATAPAPVAPGFAPATATTTPAVSSPAPAVAATQTPHPGTPPLATTRPTATPTTRTTTATTFPTTAASTTPTTAPVQTAVPTAPAFTGPVTATATTVMPSTAATPAPQPAPVVAAAAPAPVAFTAPATSARVAPVGGGLPDFLIGRFVGRVKGGHYEISYNLVNRSQRTVARLDPQTLRVSQGGVYQAARLDARDSSGEPSMLPPQASQIGIITLPLQGNAPIVLEWIAQDLSNGVPHAIKFTWTPTTAARAGEAGN